MFNLNLATFSCFLTAFVLEAHQVYPPVPDNVRPIHQMGHIPQIPPPLQQPASPHSSVAVRGSTRCYVCSWSIVQCSDFNCYNNPDICTNNNFSPSLVQQADCPAGCEQFVITDPNGIVQQWRRNCAPGNVRVSGFNCRTEYHLGIRVDRCLCNKNWCNGSHLVRADVVVVAVFALITAAIIFDLRL